MKSKILIPLVVFLFLMHFSFSSFYGTVDVSGIVESISHDPIDGASVTLSGISLSEDPNACAVANNPPQVTTITDSNGKFDLKLTVATGGNHCDLLLTVNNGVTSKYLVVVDQSLRENLEVIFPAIYIKLISPLNYSNSNDVNFEYVPVDFSFLPSNSPINCTFKVDNYTREDVTTNDTLISFNYHLSNDGYYSWNVSCKDKLNNEVFNETSFILDTQPPFVGRAIADLPFYNGFYYSQPNTLVLTYAEVNDSGSGISKCYFITDTGEKEEAYYNGTHCNYTKLIGDSQITFWFNATDNAGNSNSGESATIKIDDVEPYISISTDRYWNETPVIIHYDISDNVLIRGYKVYLDSVLIQENQSYDHQSGSGNIEVDNILNGNHLVNFTVYDIVNNTNNDMVTFCFDNQSPTLSNLQTWVVGRTVTFSWNTSDIGCAGINHSELYIDNSLVYNGTNSNYTTTLSGGDHTWKVIVYDNAGNSISKNSTVHVDNIPPQVSLISPIGKYLNSDSTLLKFKATDDMSTTMNCEVYVNSTNVWSGNVNNNTEKDIPFNGKDGYYLWKVSCSDDAGNVGNASSWFVFDTVNPTISILEPSANSYLNDSVIEIKFNVSDENLDYTNVSIYKSGSLVNSTRVTGQGIHVVNLKVSGDGNYNIIAIAYDKAGNNNSDERDNVIVDTVPPQTQINATTEDGNPYDFNWTNQTVNVELNVIDENPNVTYYRIDGGSWEVYKGKFSISTNGNHTLEYYSIDKAGNNESINTKYIAIDKEKPQTTFSPNSQDTWINTDLKVNITGIDSYSGIKGIYYLITNGTCPPVGDPSYSYSSGDKVEVTINSESKICAYPVDNAGNVQLNQSGDYKVDEIPPFVSITSPSNNSYTNNSIVEMNWTGSDSLSGIKEYYVKYDSNNWTLVGTNTSYAFNLAEGQHNLSVKAVDIAGNENITEITIYVDEEKPTISITSPTNGSITNSVNVTVSWTASDNFGIDHFDIYLNGNFVNSTNSNSYEFDNLADGQYNVKVVAYDKAGNSNSDNVTFIVDTTPPKITFISPIGWTDENPTIIFNVSDVEPNITCMVKMDGKVIYNESSSPGEIKIPLTNVGGGNHSLNITCKDWFYKSNETRTIMVDNQTPIIQIVSPLNGARIPVGSFVVKVNAIDNQSGIKYVKVIFGSRTYDLVYDGKYYTATLSSSISGQKSIVVKAEDNVNHSTTKGASFYMYTPSVGGGGAGGGAACTVNGYSCSSNADCCSGYCVSGICQAYPVNVSLNVVVQPDFMSIFDNQTAKFTIFIENKGTNPASGVTLSLSGINGSLTQNSFDLGPGDSKIVYLTIKEGIGKYVGRVIASWKNLSNSATFTLEVLDHNAPIESNLAKSVCDNASLHILTLSSEGMNVSELNKEYHKAIELISEGNYTEAKKICDSIINVTYTKPKVPTRVTPFFIAVRGIKKNAPLIAGVAIVAIVGLILWFKRAAISRWIIRRKYA